MSTTISSGNGGTTKFLSSKTDKVLFCPCSFTYFLQTGCEQPIRCKQRKEYIYHLEEHLDRDDNILINMLRKKEKNTNKNVLYVPPLMNDCNSDEEPCPQHGHGGSENVCFVFCYVICCAHQMRANIVSDYYA